MNHGGSLGVEEALGGWIKEEWMGERVKGSNVAAEGGRQTGKRASPLRVDCAFDLHLPVSASPTWASMDDHNNNNTSCTRHCIETKAHRVMSRAS